MWEGIKDSRIDGALRLHADPQLTHRIRYNAESMA
jgi:hypothetical protein